MQQFEKRMSEAPEQSGTSGASSGAGSSSADGDPYAHKRGPKPRSWRDKNKSSKEREKEKAASEKKEASAKKEPKDKKPAFLQQTASGRTPKVASRYEQFCNRSWIAFVTNPRRFRNYTHYMAVESTLGQHLWLGFRCCYGYLP